MARLSHSTMTDREVLADLGRRLRAVRKVRGLTVVETAARTGLSRRTVHRAEQGDNPTMLTVVRMLRLYGELGALETFLREPEVSPMALLDKTRKRGRHG